MTEPVYDFSERVVVVTGGSRGVGAEIVRRFVETGAHVVTCGRHEADVEGAVFMTADVRKPADAEKVVAKAVEHFGRLDVLVNNAGGAPPALFTNTSSRPKCSTAFATTFSASAGLRTSAVMNTAPSTSAS